MDTPSLGSDSLLARSPMPGGGGDGVDSDCPHRDPCIAILGGEVSASLGEFEQIAMLAVLRLGDRAYGAQIKDEIRHSARRSSSLSSIYITLMRLERKGYVSSRLCGPRPVRGGKAKRYFHLTPAGAEALRLSWESLKRLWAGQEAHPIFNGHH